MRGAARSQRRTNLIAREEARRRVILLGLAMLILLVVSPLFSHHLFRGTEAVLAGRDHLGALCLVALHTLLAPVHELFHLLFAVGLVYAACDRFRTWYGGHRMLSALQVETPSADDTFWNAARSVGLNPEKVRVANGLPTPAFTAGWFRPHIYVSRELSDRLEETQLAAVLAHEGAHLARRDPLRLSMLRFLTCTLFWIPALRRFARDITDEAEVQADDAAAERNPLVLASTIVALSRPAGEPMLPFPGVGFHRPDLLQRRVRRLLGEEPDPGSHLTIRSLAGAAGALLLIFVSGAVMAHPVPTQVAPHSVEQCPHHSHASSVRNFDLSEPYGFIVHRCDRVSSRPDRSLASIGTARNGSQEAPTPV